PDHAGIADHPVVRVLGGDGKGFHRLKQPLIPLSAGRFAIDRRGGGGAERNNLLVLLCHKGLQVPRVERINLGFEGGFEVCGLITVGQHGRNKQRDEAQGKKDPAAAHSSSSQFITQPQRPAKSSKIASEEKLREGPQLVDALCVRGVDTGHAYTSRLADHLTSSPSS